jgi:curved DNA-binding protein CbpA
VRLDGLGLSSTDAFVLSQIDGTLTLEEVSEVTGVALHAVIEIARRLAGLGAIEGPKRLVKPEGRYATHVSPPTKRTRAVTEKPRARLSKRPTPPPLSVRPEKRSIDESRVTVPAKPKPRPASPAPPPPEPPPPVVDDTCELDPAICARIDQALGAPEGQTHYAVLGVAKTATGKEIQRAYFSIAAALHPDRHFGKKLGPYKKKLDLMFRRAADAYETLRLASKRAEYDEYLKLTRRSQQMERALAPVVVEPLKKKSSKRIPAAVAAVVKAEAKAPAPPPPAPAPAPAPASEPSSSRVETARRAPVQQSKAAQILAAAQQALAAGDGVAAANHYRLALQYAEDPGARRYAESGLEEARKLLTDTHLKKARYEEKEGRWADAVVSYGKALDGRPDDPATCERLANALRQEGSDLTRAVQLAELAVQRAPRRAAYRVTLGLVYAESGSREKAIEQFERAIEIDPADEVSRRALEALKKRRR